MKLMRQGFVAVDQRRTGRRIRYLAVIAPLLPLPALALDLHVFSPGEIVSSSNMNDNFSALEELAEDLEVISSDLDSRVQLYEQAITVDGSQNVGIGTTTPTERLDVAGNIRATAFLGDGSGLTGLSGLSQWSDIAGGIHYGGGTVGIGTTLPADLLHVVGGGVIVNDTARYFGGSERFYVKGGSTLNLDGSEFAVIDGSNARKFSVISGLVKTDQPMVVNGTGLFAGDELFMVNSGGTSPFLTVKGSGNVGIGTTTPTQKLDVSGTIRATAFLGDGSGLTGIVGTTQWSDVSGGINYGSGKVGVGTAVPLQPLHVSGSDAVLRLSATGGGGTSWDLHSRQITGDFRITPSPFTTPALTITNTGRVGIGTTTPTALLDVSGTKNSTLASLHVGNWTAVGDYGDLDLINTNGGDTVVGRIRALADTSPSYASALAFFTNPGPSVGTAPTEKLRILGNGNVGIGTSTPTQRLDVSGTVKATAFVGDGSGLTGIVGTTQWSDVGGGINYGGGNVGIGTTAPTDYLHVALNANTVGGARLVNTSAGGGAYSTVHLGNSAGASDVVLFNNGSANNAYGGARAGGVGTNSTTPFVLITGGTEKMRVDNSGKVAIGTTLPVGLLTLSGASPMLYINGSDTGNQMLWFASQGANTFSIEAQSASGGTGSYLSNRVTGGGLFFRTTNSSATLNTNMFIAGSGNVGLGNISPTQKLDVTGTVKATAFVGDGSGLTGIVGTTQWSDITGGINYGGGKVGIGTTTPTGLLSLNGASPMLYVNGSDTGNQNLWFASQGANTFAIEAQSASGGAGSYLSNRVNGGAMLFRTTTSAGAMNINLFIGGNGNVGLGTVSPTEKLDVVGTVKATAFVGDGSGLTGIPGLTQWTTLGSDIYYTTGKVGIGTSNPAFTIHGSGSGFVAYDQYSSDTSAAAFIGRKARGTSSAPTQALTGDSLSGLFARGYHSGGAFGTTNVAAIQLDAAENFTATNQGSIIRFGTTPLASTTRVERMRIDSTGYVGIGTTSPLAQLEVQRSGFPVSIDRRNYTTDANTARGVSSFVLANTGAAAADGFGPLVRFDLMDSATGGDISTNAGYLADLGAVRSGANNSGDLVFRTVNVGSAAERLRITKSGNVGIGTTAPANTLDVQGNRSRFNNILVGETLASTWDLIQSVNPLRVASNGTYVTLEATGVEVLRASSTGALGIGTTAPTSKMELYDNTNSALTFKVNQANTGASARSRVMLVSGTDSAFIGLNPQGAGEGFIVQNITPDRPIVFWTNDGGSNAERMRLTDAGFLGIGTDAPTQKLDVVGTVQATAFVGDGSGLTGIVGLSQWDNISGGIAYPNGNIGIGTSLTNVSGASSNFSVASLLGPVAGILEMGNETNTTSANSHLGVMSFINGTIETSRIHGLTSGTDSGYLALYTKPAGSVIAERFRISAAGSVGIGTSAPGDFLHVSSPNPGSTAGPVLSSFPIARFMTRTSSDSVERGLEIGAPTSSVSAPVFLKVLGTSSRFAIVNESDVEQLTISTTGSVGVGTSAPQGKLQVYNDTPYDGVDSNFAADSLTLYGAAGGADGSYFGGITWSNLSRRRAGISSVMENADGDYVGLAFFTQGTDGPGPMYESMRISWNGDVGIGTTTPRAEFDVQGRNVVLGTIPVTMGYAVNGYPGVGYNFLGQSDGTWNYLANDTAYMIGLGQSHRIDFNYAPVGTAGNTISWTTGMSLLNTGLVGIGTITPSEKLHVIGNILASGTITAASDIRLKTDIEPLENASDGIACLSGVTFRWKDPSLSESRQIGLIAQDVERCFPEVVQTNNDGMKSIAYAQLVVPLIENAKEQQTLVQWQSSRLETLGVENTRLSQDLQAQKQLAASQALRIQNLDREVTRLRTDQEAVNARMARIEARQVGRQ